MNEIEQWRERYARVSDLLGDLTPDQAATSVPACPDWSVKDLTAHMVGLAADVLDGDEPDDHNEAWTQAQVDSRREADLPDVLREWSEVAEPLCGWMAENGTRPLNDVVIHEQDLRGALDLPGGRDGEGLRTVRERLAGRFADAASDLPPLLLVETEPQRGTEPWSFVTHGTPDDARTVLSADGYELFRALTSRRTADQLRDMTVAGDVTPYLDALAGLGPLPEQPLPE